MFIMEKFNIDPSTTKMLTKKLAKRIAEIQIAVDPMLKTESIVESGQVEVIAAAEGDEDDEEEEDSSEDYASDSEIDDDAGNKPMENSKVNEGGSEGRSEGSIKIEAINKVDGFNNFSTKVALQPGVCVLRKLGNGKYEIVNLKTISLDNIMSRRGGLELDKNQDRANMFYVPTYEWVEVIKKCTIAAAMYSDKHIFNFRGLPIELRYKIYELVVPPRRLRKLEHSGIEVPRHNTGYNKTVTLMAVCRQFAEEVRPLFYKNNFNLRPHRWNDFNFPRPTIAENVQEVTYSWCGLAKEAPHFAKLASLPKLKILNLDVSDLTDRRRNTSASPNQEYQDNESLKPYCGYVGFDKLVKLRGLKRVSIVRWVFYRVSLKAEKPAGIKAFETFLNGVLTLPKPPARQKRVTKPRASKTKAPAS